MDNYEDWRFTTGASMVKVKSYTTSTTANGTLYVNGNGYLDSGPTITLDPLIFRKYETFNEGGDEIMEMPYYYICTASGAAVDKAKTEEDAKRKAKNYAAANKCEVYVMQPVFRFEPADVPVKEVKL